jgi:hypothetical protein
MFLANRRVTVAPHARTATEGFPRGTPFHRVVESPPRWFTAFETSRADHAQELQRFCVGVQPGWGRLVQCLSSHTSELSTACGNMIAAIRRTNASFPSRLILHQLACGVWVMFKRGRLIGDVFASIGVLLAIAGVLLLLAQYFVWLRRDIWHPMNIRMV